VPWPRTPPDRRIETFDQRRKRIKALLDENDRLFLTNM
jgi:hypothetical protein